MNKHPRVRQRGLSLLEALIALVILAFGLLGFAGMQVRMLSASTDTQWRLQATALADRLLSHAIVDSANAGCYLVPTQGTCSSTQAQAAREQWLVDVAALPEGAASAAFVTVPMGGTSYAGSNQQMRVRIQWQGKIDGAMHVVEATTDVR
jgi:type IV pilus assembly protein PilV